MTFTDARRFPTIDYIGRTVGVYDGYDFEPDFDDFDTDCDCCCVVEDHATITAATLREFVRDYGDICGVPLESQNDFLSFCHVSTGYDQDEDAKQIEILQAMRSLIDDLIDCVETGEGILDMDIELLADSVDELNGWVQS